MQKTRKTYYANGTDIGDAMIHRGIYYLNGAEATTQDWTGKPSDWSDIRKDCPANSIALYAGHKADYSQYDNLGFTATCDGGYKVYIDGNAYGSYSSGSTCKITWSTSGITTGDDITTPSALKAHKIWIEPATSGNNITRFASARVSTGSDQEYQGKLWIHFNLSTPIIVDYLLRANASFSVNNICKAITAKNNTLICKAGLASMCQNGNALEYLPTLVAENETPVKTANAFNGCEVLKTITLKNFKISSTNYLFNNCYALEKIKHTNTEILNSVNSTINSQYNECHKLQNLLPETYTANISRAQNYIHNTPELKDTVIDLRGATALIELGIFSNSAYFAKGIKGVRVSNEAPFTLGGTQINVSYTGMDRNALVQLFNDLPYNVGYEVVGSPTITDGVISGLTSANYLTCGTINFGSFDTVEMVVGFNIASYPSSGQYRLFGNSDCEFYMGTNGRLTLKFKNLEGNNEQIYSPSSIPISTNCKAKAVTNKTANEVLFYLDIGNGYELIHSFASSIRSHSETFTIGGRSSADIDGTINLNNNNTIVKVNGITWFRGQPAMTKILSCVGATGTADLTAEDKDIALNKGWSLTLS